MYMKRTKRTRRALVLIVSCILLFFVVVSGVVAYIIARTAPIENEFIPAEVTCKIEETFQNNVKQDVFIRNTGNTDAYIRAMVVVNWVAESEGGKILSVAPVEGTDYSVEWGAEGWIKGADGFWYYSNAVAVQDVTKDLIEKVVPMKDAPEGYRLHVQILASAIQAMPEYVVEQEWNATIQDGMMIPNE